MRQTSTGEVIRTSRLWTHAPWRRWAGATAALALAAGALQWQTARLLVPRLPPSPVGAAAPMADVARYQVVVEARVVDGIRDNLSGLTYSPYTGTLFAVINSPSAVVELSTHGRLLRQLPLRGVTDPEGIAHIDGDWFAIADERRNQVHWLQIEPHQQSVSVGAGPHVALGDVAIKNLALEGLGWDRQRQQLIAVTEKWPLRVLAIDAPLLQPRTGAVQPRVQAWGSQGTAGLPTTDLASVEVEPRSGNLLLLGEESSVLYEYSRQGELLGLLPLWADAGGLRHTIPQPEGVAMDNAGVLYVVSEPNLFYRYEKRS